MNQASFGEKLGWPQSVVSQIESGKLAITHERLIQALDLFRVELAALGYTAEDFIRFPVIRPSRAPVKRARRRRRGGAA